MCGQNLFITWRSQGLNIHLGFPFLSRLEWFVNVDMTPFMCVTQSICSYCFPQQRGVGEGGGEYLSIDVWYDYVCCQILLKLLVLTLKSPTISLYLHIFHSYNLTHPVYDLCLSASASLAGLLLL